MRQKLLEREPVVSLQDEHRRTLLASFLRSRRQAVDPRLHGISTAGRRRTPGLRREELATLAHVGVAWYTALEQGRDVHPSEPILASLARVFELSDAETRHLFFLAGKLYPTDQTSAAKLGPGVDLIVTALSPYPAYVLDRLWNYVAWNGGAALLFDLSGPPGSLNLVRELFLNPDKRTLYPQWDDVAFHVVSEFRRAVEPAASDQAVRTMVEELRGLSPSFERLWAAHPIQATRDRTKILLRPEGTVQYDYTTLALAAAPGFTLVVYTPAG